LAKIGEINDHNIDPRLFRLGVGLLYYKESVGIPTYSGYLHTYLIIVEENKQFFWL
jgi:hypothetical protein